MQKALKLVLLLTLNVIISFTTALAGVFLALNLLDKDNEVTTKTVTQQNIEVVNEESAVIDVAESAKNSVVSIVITKDVAVYENYYYNPFENNPFFDGFEIPRRKQSGTQEQEIGAGTGFVVSSDGLIITNKHVVDDNQASYTVIFANGNKFDAEVLAKDTLLDIAFIKIEASNLTPLSLGTSENLKVGQKVIAVGNALGEFSNTVSTGIISGLSRDIIASDATGKNFEQIDDVIQTDASINSGNSGGPLLDIRGNVIGVNVAVAQDAENIGFAIPIDVVKTLIERYNEEGSIKRPVLGVRYRLIDEYVQEANDLAFNYGAIVTKGDKNELAVIPSSPADKAGIVENDIILEINGVKVDSENTLLELVQTHSFGDEIEVKLYSKGEIKILNVVLEDFKIDI